MTNLVDGLSASIRGTVIGQDHARYDHARRAHNGMVDFRPAVIARPVDDSDIASAVRFARAEGLPIAVRGGGHSVAGHSVGEGSLVIDLRLGARSSSMQRRDL